MSIEGKGHIPSFLVHDSPREADLGASIYNRIFDFGHRLENSTPAPLFQYIITTTTEPPKNSAGIRGCGSRLEGHLRRNGYLVSICELGSSYNEN